MSQNKVLPLASFLIIASAGLVFLGLPLDYLSTKEFIPQGTSLKKDRNETVVKQPTVAALRIEGKVEKAVFFSASELLVTQKGNDLLVLVNKKITLPKDFVPGNLIGLDGVVAVSYNGLLLRADAAGSLQRMFNSAKEAGFTFSVVSSYRSYAQQGVVFNNWVASAGLKNAETFSARPGHSQHQLGTTVDVHSPGKPYFSAAFGATPEGQWLASNGYKFGYILSYPAGKETITGYAYEPWHFRYIGEESAAKLVQSGLILEEYLQKYGVW